MFRYRSALPLHIWTGYDLNADGVNNDIYTTAFKLTDVDDEGNPTYKDIGACETVNCGRGAALSQFNLRVSKVFRLPHGMNVEGDRGGVQPLQRDQPELADAGVRACKRRSSPARRRTTPEHRVHEADGSTRATLARARAARRHSSGSGLRSNTCSIEGLSQARGLRLPGLSCLRWQILSALLNARGQIAGVRLCQAASPAPSLFEA